MRTHQIKVRRNLGLTYTACLAVSLVGGGMAQASSIFTQVLNGYGDRTTGTAINSDTKTVAGEVAQGSGSGTFNLEDADGDGILSYSFSGMASTTYNSLKVSSTASVQNTFFDSEYNYNEGTGYIPTEYGAQSIARFTDTLQYQGTAVNYTSRYIFRLTGTVSGSPYSGARISFKHANEPFQNWFFDDDGNYDTIVTSEAYVHGNSAQEIMVQLLSQVDIFTEDFTNGSDVAGNVSFGNTLELIGVDLRDENGNLAPQGTITRISGAPIAIIAIPEPSTLGLGMFCCAFFIRRRR